MTRDEFWDVIARVNAKAGSSFDARTEALAMELEKLPTDEIVAFQEHFDDLHTQAYTWDLWGAAYIIGGGCSDDGFMDFRSWLISMGRQTYEKALVSAETLAEVELGPDAEEDSFFEEFAYVASKVWETKTGEDQIPRRDREHPADPSGERWEEEGDDLAERFPKLWAKHGN